ncbi:MAG: hypothetical protein ACI4MN_00020 [Candidatus Coproplasma sp.]
MSMRERRRMLLATLGGNLKFYITYNGVIYEYQFESGMVWSDFVASKYNDGNFTVNGTVIQYHGYTVSKTTPVATTDEIAEDSYTAVAPLVIYVTPNTALTNGVGTGFSVKNTGIYIQNSGDEAGLQKCGYIGASSAAGFDVTKYAFLSITAKISPNNNTSYPGYVGYYESGATLANITSFSYTKREAISTTTAKTVNINISDVTSNIYVYLNTSNGENSRYLYATNITLS